MSTKKKVIDENALTIRMYNVGFGDSFLLLFPKQSGRRPKMLIDCGTHQHSINPPPIKGVVEQIIKDVTENGVPRIDVVVATHRHRDHVLGFQNKAWSKVNVTEVWMPWTEDPVNDEARRIREIQSKAAQRVKKMAEKHFRLALTPTQKEKAEQAMVIASNNLVNKEAMKTLHTGFSAKSWHIQHRYLPVKERGEIFEPLCIPDLKVHVLGPSKDPDVIANMENSKEEYLAMSTLGLPPMSNISTLFRSEWIQGIAQYQNSEASKHLALKKPTLRYIEELGAFDLFAAASSLEGAVNGTSLMLVFEIGDRLLLFPGDAQWGTWEAVLKDEKCCALLERLTFYKIGHHGSHNATPKTFVRKYLPDNFWGMVCTGPTAKWTDTIPRPTLMTALRKKSKNIARSDKVLRGEPANFRRKKGVYVELDIRIG